MKAKTPPRGQTRRRSTRVGETHLAAPVTLFAQIEAEQHEGLRAIAFAQRRSLAAVVREALTDYLARHRPRTAGWEAAASALASGRR